ncbi:MAG: DUF3553 domain-containing protein [Vicinamibacterales bacterium]
MHAWNPGDRVRHAQFGLGTLLEATEQHLVIHFDHYGRKKFAASVVALSPASVPGGTSITTMKPAYSAPAASARRSGTRSERPTDVGYENLNEQTVVAIGSGPPVERVYVLECRRCGARYGERAADIPVRRCPSCMGAAAGLPV